MLRLPSLTAMLLAAGALVACASDPSSAPYNQSSLRGCAVDMREYPGACPDSHYVPEEPWPYTYYPLAAIPVYPVVPVYPAAPPLPPPTPPKHHRRPVGGHCEKPNPKKPAHGCP